jgi:hypothetical protein
MLGTVPICLGGEVLGAGDEASMSADDARAFADLASRLHEADSVQETIEHVVQFALKATGATFSGVALAAGSAELKVGAVTSPLVAGLFTTLARGPLTCKAVAAELGLQHCGTADWLDAMVSLGLIERTGDEYANAAAIDIGAAEGCVPVQIARRHPHLTGGGLDLPAAEPIFDEYVASNGLADRLQFYPGDFFADPLPPADVLIMGHILHDWSLDEKLLLIRNAYDALPDGGALVVYESIIDDDRRANTFGLLMSVNMLIETQAGFDYTFADCRSWMADAGFRDTYAEPLAGPDSMVVGIK